MPHPVDEHAWRALLPLARDSALPLQVQLRAAIVRAIVDRRLMPQARLPSTRVLAQTLELARNTVNAVYTSLVTDGWLLAPTRQGHRVNPDARAPAPSHGVRDGARGSRIDWSAKLAGRSTGLGGAPSKAPSPATRYAFVTGQVDVGRPPPKVWHDLLHQSIDLPANLGPVASDGDRDHPELLEQVARHVLPRRGIHASPDRILITLGEQQALALVAAALGRDDTVVGLESPVSRAIWDTWRWFGAHPIALTRDDQGVQVRPPWPRCTVVQVSPNHPAPTALTLGVSARQALLEAAIEHDLLVIENDPLGDLSFEGMPLPALQAMDSDDRVIHLASLSQSIGPGLGLGCIVAAPPLITRLRAIRRLLAPPPPMAMQHALARYYSLGHHDLHLRRRARSLALRARLLCDALRRRLPQLSFVEPQGGTAVWVRTPEGTDLARLLEAARTRGVVFETDETWLPARRPSAAPHLLLGFGSIAPQHIEPGIAELAAAFADADTQAAPARTHRRETIR
jgi:GntR family transcriptional regulator/MocR family aminotransferase